MSITQSETVPVDIPGTRVQTSSVNSPLRRPRHRDVAALAGVSPATVSKVIGGRETERISAETRQRVLDAVQKLNYVPQSAVREMQTGRTGRIGVLLNHPAAFGTMDPYHVAILGGILQEAFEHRRNTLLYTALDPHADTLRQEILGGGADGVIAVGKVWTTLVERVVSQANLPVVYISVLPQNEVARNVPYFGVDCNNEEGGRLAIEHLANLGHRHIGIAGEFQETPTISFMQERLVGVQNAASATGVLLSYISYADVEKTVADIAGGIPNTPTALFFFEGEGLAVEVVTVMAPRYGLLIPESLSIMTFNSTALSTFAPISITSIRQPLAEIGAKAVAVLVDYLENGATDSQHMGSVSRFPVSLDIRNSTAPPRGA